MTRDDIIRMAREAGLSTAYAVIAEHPDGTQTVLDHRPFLERFAALVAAANRADIPSGVCGSERQGRLEQQVLGVLEMTDRDLLKQAGVCF